MTLLFIYVCGSVGHVCTGVFRSHKRALEPSELECQMVVSHLMWVLGTKQWFSTRTVHALKH